MDDLPENARSLDDNFTVTGRLKSRLNEEMWARRLDSMRLPRYMRDTLEDLENPPEKSEPLLVGVDFVPIESRAVMDIGPVEKLHFEKPIKQNGKDASYLNLDPTKHHGKRRRR